jgi:hypothetical protein
LISDVVEAPIIFERLSEPTSERQISESCDLGLAREPCDDRSAESVWSERVASLCDDLVEARQRLARGLELMQRIFALCRPVEEGGEVSLQGRRGVDPAALIIYELFTCPRVLPIA